MSCPAPVVAVRSEVHSFRRAHVRRRNLGRRLSGLREYRKMHKVDPKPRIRPPSVQEDLEWMMLLRRWSIVHSTPPWTVSLHRPLHDSHGPLPQSRTMICLCSTHPHQRVVFRRTQRRPGHCSSGSWRASTVDLDSLSCAKNCYKHQTPILGQ